MIICFMEQSERYSLLSLGSYVDTKDPFFHEDILQRHSDQYPSPDIRTHEHTGKVNTYCHALDNRYGPAGFPQTPRVSECRPLQNSKWPPRSRSRPSQGHSINLYSMLERVGCYKTVVA